MKKLALMTFLCLFASLCYAATIRVPQDQPTIQAGIDAAGDGDIVLVADGRYTGEGNRNLDFKGKRITVKSENGPDKCIIDCEEKGRGFFFHSGENHRSVVEGFTIMNGGSKWGGGLGGGIYCKSSSPTIRNNTITGNYAKYGGGIYCESGSPILVNNTIMGNFASSAGTYEPSASGGGIYCENGSPNILNNTITANSVRGQGGGGGISCSGAGSPIIMNNTITGNSVTNYVSADGGGIHCSSGSPRIINNTITGNLAVNGGGIHCFLGFPKIINNTITGNSAIKTGGGIHCENSLLTITNTILWKNVSAQGSEIFVDGRGSSSTIKVSYSLVAGGQAGIGEKGTVNWLDGNINADPLFVDAFNGDYHLQGGSPCIDVGTADGVPPEDIEGKPRPIGKGVDIGAYEYGDSPVE